MPIEKSGVCVPLCPVLGFSCPHSDGKRCQSPNGHENCDSVRKSLLRCPKCYKLMSKVSDRGPGKGPNGGHLCVMEDMGHATEGYDFDIEMWKCSNCGLTVYVSLP